MARVVVVAATVAAALTTAAWAMVSVAAVRGERGRESAHAVYTITGTSTPTGTGRTLLVQPDA